MCAISHCLCWGCMTLRRWAMQDSSLYGREELMTCVWHCGVWHCRSQPLAEPQCPQASFSCPGSQGSPRPGLSPGRECTKFAWEPEVEHLSKSSLERARPSFCGACRLQMYTVLCTIPYVLSSGCASSLRSLWVLTGKPGVESRKVDFCLLRCLLGPQAKLY